MIKRIDQNTITVNDTDEIPYYVRCCSIYLFLVEEVGQYEAREFDSAFTWLRVKKMWEVKEYIKKQNWAKADEEKALKIASGRLLYYIGHTGKDGYGALCDICEDFYGEYRVIPRV